LEGILYLHFSNLSNNGIVVEIQRTDKQGENEDKCSGGA